MNHKYSTSSRLATNNNSSAVMSVKSMSCKEGFMYPGGSWIEPVLLTLDVGEDVDVA